MIKNLKLFIFSLFLISFIPLNSYALNIIEPKDNLTNKCINFMNNLINNDIIEIYPQFAKNGNESIIYGFKCLNLDKGNKKNYTLIYEFYNADMKETYYKLHNILSNKSKKDIFIRKNIPDNNAEDGINITTSIKNENQGHTCYIYKNENELWIGTKPTKWKSAVFIIQQNDNNSKIYFYETLPVR